MGARSYPIWIDVTACTYGSSKSYGAKGTNSQKILVGSGPANSETHCSIVTTKRFREHPEHGDVVVFQTSLNDKILCISVFKRTKRDTAGELIYQIDGTKKLKGVSWVKRKKINGKSEIAA